MKNSKPPLWWGDTLGIARQDDGRVTVEPNSLIRIETSSCPNPEHDIHVILKWGDGTTASLRPDPSGEYDLLANQTDQRQSWMETIVRRQATAEIARQALESYLEETT